MSNAHGGLYGIQHRGNLSLQLQWWSGTSESASFNAHQVVYGPGEEIRLTGFDQNFGEPSFNDYLRQHTAELAHGEGYQTHMHPTKDLFDEHMVAQWRVLHDFV